MAADTSSCAAAATCVVEAAAAVLADLIADPMPVKSCAAALNASGEADTKDDNCGSYQDTPSR
jgi:hypothetical protein